MTMITTGKSPLHEFVECDGGASAIANMKENLTGEGLFRLTHMPHPTAII